MNHESIEPYIQRAIPVHYLSTNLTQQNEQDDYEGMVQISC